MQCGLCMFHPSTSSQWRRGKTLFMEVQPSGKAIQREVAPSPMAGGWRICRRKLWSCSTQHPETCKTEDNMLFTAGASWNLWFGFIYLLVSLLMRYSPIGVTTGTFVFIRSNPSRWNQHLHEGGAEGKLNIDTNTRYNLNERTIKLEGWG